jgi:hypothetical protein
MQRRNTCVSEPCKSYDIVDLHAGDAPTGRGVSRTRYLFSNQSKFVVFRQLLSVF